jgi:hypothetical protein
MSIDYAHGGSNRGFTVANRRAQAVNPAVRRLNTPRGANNPLAPRIPRVKEQTQPDHIWPNPPKWWLHSVEEWIVYWYLKYHLRWEEDVEFFYQSRVYTQRLFASKDFTQADFLIPYGPRSRLGYNGNYTALVLDPFTTFTHTLAFDKERRDELELARYKLVFLAEWPLKFQTVHVMTEALFSARDLTDRAH